jgi:hypothetical protein
VGINSYTVVNWIGAAAAKQYVVEGPFALTTGLQIQFGITPKRVTEVQIYGFRSIGTNTQPVPNGAAALISSNGANAMLVETLPAGGVFVLQPGPGIALELTNIFVLGTTGDSVYIKYLQ